MLEYPHKQLRSAEIAFHLLTRKRIRLREDFIGDFPWLTYEINGRKVVKPNYLPLQHLIETIAEEEENER